MSSFRAVLSRNPNDIRALDGMAEACKQAGDLERAAGYIDQLQQLYAVPEVQIERRLRALSRERQRRDAELLRIRNIAALNVMATGIAHELRQPLSVIRLAAQNARKDLERDEVSREPQPRRLMAEEKMSSSYNPQRPYDRAYDVRLERWSG